MKTFIQKLKTYYKSNWRSIDFIPAWNYLQYKEKQDVRFLLKGIDYEELPLIFQRHHDRLDAVGSEMGYQVTQFEIENNRRNTNIFDLTKRIQIKKAEYNNIRNICNYLLVAGPDDDFTIELYKAGFIIDKTKDFKGQIRIVLNSNENKLIKIYEDESELLALTKDTSGKKMTTDDVLNELDRFNKKDIDLKKITMKRYLSLTKELNDYIEKMKAKAVKHG
jgi:hypothetical protein